METVQAFGNGNNRVEAAAVVLTPAMIHADPVAAMAAVSAAVTGSIVTIGRDDADAAVSAAIVTILENGAMSIGDALAAYVATARDGRDDSGDNAATIGYLSDERFVTIAADEAGEDAAPRARSFKNGATITATAAGVTLTLATGETVQGMRAAILAQGYALAEASAAAHGSAAAARGAANSAAATVTDARLAALVREHGNAYGGAAIIAEAMGWITADSTKGQRLAAMNRARVAISRMKRRTGGEDHSTRA
jgi:hypothetical protein